MLWTDPRNGQRVQRESLGCCLHGRLFLQPNDKTSGVDLDWAGFLARATFSCELCALIEMAWRNLELLTHKKLPAPRPITVSASVYWLARLAPPVENYLIEEREGGGWELFELFAPRPKIVIRRPVC